MQKYLELAKQGKNQIWRCILAVVVMLCAWQVIGAIPSAILLVWMDINGQLQTYNPGSALPGMDTSIGFVALMLASVCFLGGIYLSMRFIHHRPLRTLITPARRIDWKRLFQGFATWLALITLMSVIEAVLHPGRYAWTFDMGRFIPYLFLALIFIPIQTSTEELFFRGYVLQETGLRVKNIWVLSTISGLLFGIPHMLNPEATVNYPLLGLYYFAFGFCLAFITLKDGKLELALGAHAANNLFSVLIANYTITALPSPSLFTIKVLDAFYSVPAALVGMAIFIALFIGPWREKSPVDAGV
ncbi:MAG TPA: type II CAAX endopeptidase family protein [Anaerolineales bacterium]|nr:type II CAAX endopeptidase family protein [Anaerolineales bacterium]